MTAVVGVVGKTGVLLAGDAQGSDELSHRMSKEAKCFELSEVLAVAYHGSGRLGQILQYQLTELEDPPLGRDEHRWVVRDFIPYLRAVTEEEGHMHIRYNVEHLGESGFLFAVRGRLFTVYSDLCVDEHEEPYDAMGSGEANAVGAMHAIVHDDAAPMTAAQQEKVALAGVRAACKFNNYVGGAITSVRTSLFTEDELAYIRKHGRRA